jgi:hypothetical protein
MTQILKYNDEQQKVWAVCLEPDSVDQQGDFIDPEEIEKAAHTFFENYTRGKAGMGIEHQTVTPDVLVCESYIAPVTFSLNGVTVVKGSWVVCSKILNSNLWKKIKNGEIGGYSIGGSGTRTPMEVF